MMMGVQQKRKSGGEPEARQQQQQQQQQHHHQSHQQLKRRRAKATTGTAQSREMPSAPAPAPGSEESVWIFGLISNIEQLLYNVATNGSSGGQSSGSSTPSSTTSTISSPSSLSSSSSASMGAALAASPSSCAAHHQVPRSPISRQIKFHEYKGPPAAKRQASGAGSNRSQQPSGQAKLQLQAQTSGARCKAPIRSHLASHSSAAAQPQQQQQKLLPVQQQQQTRTIAKQQPHQSPQQQARHQQSATNQLTSAVVAPPAANSNATFSVLPPAAATASAAHLQPQQQQQIVYGSADTSQAAIEEPRLGAQRQVMASQAPMAIPRPLEQQQQPQPQQQLGDFELAMLQLAAAAAVDDDLDFHQDKSTRGPDLGSEVPDQVEAYQLEPSIAPFACSGVEELLFSEFIDLQDVPMNVDESDWLRKFLPPCNSLGSR